MTARLLATLAIVLVLATSPGAPARAAEGDDWPSRPTRFIVPFAAGGATDIIGRMVAQEFSEIFKQQFVVDNRPGAGASIGANLVAKAAPDGSTLLLTNSGSHGAAPGLFKNLPYDPVSDFSHIALVATTPTVLVINPKFPARNLAEFLAWARANPGKLNFATSGNGSSAHLVGELLMQEGQIRMVHVPYKGAGPAMTDVLAFQVPAMFDSLGSSSARIRTGELRGLAISATHRQKGFPDLPTFAEQGLPNVVSTSWFGVSGPKNLPATIQTRLTRAVTRMLQGAEFQARLDKLEFEPSSLPPEDFARFIRQESERWTRVIRRAGITLE